MSGIIHTIGYSPFSAREFADVLKDYGIESVLDVRSMPYSRFRPEFNKAAIDGCLCAHGIDYHFLGDLLGGRPQDDAMYEKGRVVFGRLAGSSTFLQGLDRLRELAIKQRVCLMCAEKDPITCHRTILVCRQLRQEFAIVHILEGGSVEDHHATERRLVKTLKIPTDDLFRTEEELIEDAYEMQAAKIGHRRSDR